MRRRLISVAIVVLFTLSANPAWSHIVTQDDQTGTQLPRSVRPSHYDISLVPDGAAATFTGAVKIDIDVLKPTTEITLNAADLVFQHVQVRAVHSHAKEQTAQVNIDADLQTATFRFEHPLAIGRYTLAIDYSGLINAQATGLFSLDYETPEGRKRALYTQFENSDARRMIPSWDEPAYKATFTVHATVPENDMAVSNMPVVQQKKLDGGRNEITFAPSPKMSSYLLFFALGEFDRATAKLGKTELGVITRKGATSQAAFALDASRAILQEYNDYFGVPFPLPKLDNVSGPGTNQFFGAMENWGAIFTFDHSMLLDPAISTVSDKQDVFETEAHEIAHQWFGDLVTMRWWDDLWLNEGFASWMESRTTEHLHPEWDTKMEAVAVAQRAMDADSLVTTHSVVQRIDTVDQASQAFDMITYGKGEAVIRMLEAYVGSDAWRQGVRSYIKAHAYGNTASNDLWHEMDRVAGQKVSDIAHDFTMQPGVPLIRVDDVQCIDGKSLVSLTQSEFSNDQQDKPPLRWRVPLLAQVVGSKQVTRIVVSDGKASLRLPGCGAVLVNAGQSGYFHTQYTDKTFPAIAASFPTLAPIDQLGVLADSWAMGLAGTQPISRFFDLASATPMNANPQVWGQIARAFDSANRGYRQEPERQKTFAAFAIARLSPVMARVGWMARADESASIVNLREQLIGTLADLGDASVIAEARRRYTAQASEPDAVPVALRRVITSVVASHADAATWDALHESARKEASPLVKDKLYDLLALSEDESLAKRALELALTDEPGATNSAAMISRVANLHPDLAFDFALAHVEQINQLVDNGSRSRYFPSLASGSADPAIIDKLKAYADTNLATTARHDVEIAIATVKSRIKTHNGSEADIDAWLSKVQ